MAVVGEGGTPKSAVPKSTVIVWENAPARLLPGSADEPVEYPLSFASFLL